MRPPRYVCWFKQVHESYGSIPRQSISWFKGKFARTPHISWKIDGFRLRFPLRETHKSPTVHQVMCINLAMVLGPHLLWICEPQFQRVITILAVHILLFGTTIFRHTHVDLSMGIFFGGKKGYTKPYTLW